MPETLVECPLKEVHLDPPRGIKLVYKDGTETEVVLGMNCEDARKAVKGSFNFHPGDSHSYPWDYFKNYPLSFHYDEVDLNVIEIKLIFIEDYEYLQNLEVFYQDKSILNIPERKLDDWFEEELGRETSSKYSGFIVDELGLAFNYKPGGHRIEMIFISEPGKY